MTAPQTVFLALPTYDGTRHDISTAAVLTASQRYAVTTMPIASSFLPHCFNMLWVNAIVRGCDYWAMLHSDLGADPAWVDTMIDELERTGADVMSAAVSIKSMEGRISTAVGLIGREAEYRLSGKDLKALPVTFDISDVERVTGQRGVLLVNTGCWVCRLKQAWNRKVCFHFQTDIRWDGDVGHCVQIPEDWDFSHQCAQLGLRVMATRVVGTDHRGLWSWKIKGAVDAQGQDLQAMPAAST